MKLRNYFRTWTFIISAFICNICQKKYTTLGALRTHRSYDCGQENKYGCKYCSYASNRKYDLQKHHRRKHLEEDFLGWLLLLSNFRTQVFIRMLWWLYNEQLDYETISLLYKYYNSWYISNLVLNVDFSISIVNNSSLLPTLLLYYWI